MADIKQIEVSGTKYNISGAAIVLEDNGTTTAGQFKAKTNQITSLVEGQMFLYKLPLLPSSNGNSTLNITANGTALGAKIIVCSGYQNDMTCDLTVYDRNIYLLMIYSNSRFEVINSPSGFLCNITKIMTTTNSYSNTDIEMYSNAIMLSLSRNNGSYQRAGISIYDNSMYFKSSYATNLRLDLGSEGPVLNFFSGDNQYDCWQSSYYGTKICSTKSFKFETDGFEIHSSSRTKIYLSDNAGYDYNPQLDFIEEDSRSGLYINRPIHIASPDDNSFDFGTSLKYNKTDDCLDIIFE